MNNLDTQLKAAQLLWPQAIKALGYIWCRPLDKGRDRFFPTSAETCVALLEKLPEIQISKALMHGELYRTAYILGPDMMMKHEAYAPTLCEAVYECVEKIVESSNE